MPLITVQKLHLITVPVRYPRSIFAVDSTAYIATDGWASVGSYIDVAESFLASKAMNSGSSIYTPVTYEIPSLPRFMVKNSNSAATEFKFSIAATGK